MKALIASPPAAVLRRAVDRPQALFWLALVVLVVGAWAALALVVPTGEEATLVALLTASLCGPHGLIAGWTGFASLFAMWAAMAFAMMLPTAAPMISTYLDIAEAAHAKRMAIVPAGVLVAGYMAVWLVASAAAAAAQIELAGPASMLAAPPALTAGALLVAAGLYQLSPVKHACLTKCRRPMPYFLSRWSDTVAGVFRMGVEQGLLCLGCCLGLMALMFAGAFMNLAAMVVLAVVMLAEKAHPHGVRIARLAGSALLAAGACLIFISMV